MKNKKQIIGSIIGILSVLVLAWGIYQAYVMRYGATAIEDIQSSDIAEGEATASQLPVLEENEDVLLKMLYADYVAGNLEMLAEDLIGAYDDLELLLTKFDAGKYVYDGTRFVSLESGEEVLEGMLLASPSKVFLGRFQFGYPTGQTLVISAFEADVRRYDYAKGDFSKGKLYGMAEIGSVNLDLPESKIKAIKKTGDFVADLMTGDGLYSLVLEDGTEVSWNIKTENGSTIVDDAWIYDETADTYKLADNNEGIHYYEIKKDMVSEVRWRNLLTWEY